MSDLQVNKMSSGDILKGFILQHRRSEIENTAIASPPPSKHDYSRGVITAFGPAAPAGSSCNPYQFRNVVIHNNQRTERQSAKLDSSSCRYSQYEVTVPKSVMDNPARTSTVVLENFCVQVANFMKDPSYKVVKSFSKAENGLWACDVSVKWPTPNQFRAEQSKKTEAARMASLLAIQWLQSQNKMDYEGRPRLVENNIPSEIDLNVNADAIQRIFSLHAKYVQEVKTFYHQYENEHGGEIRRFLDDNDFPTLSLSNDERDERDDLLACKLRAMPPRYPLPIDEHGLQIVETIENNRVVVLKGATGSGKTTRVPQLILDHYIRAGMGSNCNIIITQPRRISAVSLAARIASERSEKLGFCLGHHVRFSHCYPSHPGSIVFVSSGMLLQRMVHDPMLENISHVIIDEAHERDLNIDLLLMLSKELLRKNDQLRVVIMSATINAELFQQYFDNCPLISIPGSMYDVRTHYIDDDDMRQYFGNHQREYDERDVDDTLIISVVRWIHCNKPEGTILVFLPGWSDIWSIQQILQENDQMFVLTAHSKMKVEQQELIFQKPPDGKRKVILATNIAESSITIPDVVYVVDSGLAKEVGMIKKVKGLLNAWISKATADQRLGRAGRVQEGECFRLYSRKKYESFDQYPTPQIMKASLESLLIRMKMYSDDDVRNTLSKFPNTPPAPAVINAVRYLQLINVFDGEQNLTPLGRRVAMCALHPLLSVALVYSVFFKCFGPMLFTTSNLNGDASIFPVGLRSGDRRNLLAERHPTNDFVATYKIYDEWKKNLADESVTYFNAASFENFSKVLQLNLDYLFKAHLITVDDIVRYDAGESDEDVETLIAPVLFAVTARLAANVRPFQVSGKANHFLATWEGRKAQIGKDSVNFKNSQLSSFLTYYHMSTTEEGFLRIFETAQISPLSVLLFASMLPTMFPSGVPGKVKLVYPNIDLHIVIKESDLVPLLNFRAMVQDSLQFFVAYYDSYAGEPELIAQFNQELIGVLKSLIKDSGAG